MKRYLDFSWMKWIQLKQIVFIMLKALGFAIIVGKIFYIKNVIKCKFHTIIEQIK